MSTIDDIQAKITADSSGYTAAMSAAQKSTSDATDSMGEAFKNCGELLDVTVTAPLTALAYTAVASFNSATQAVTLLSAEVKATGDASGYSATQLETMASNLDVVYGLGKTDIMSGVINSLLKFQNISGTTFSDAARDATAWAATGQVSLSEASEKIGMALENPTRAFALLRGSMANLLPDQQQTIAGFMSQGNVAAAQKIVIDSLNKSYGDMATAMGRNSTPAKQMASDWKTIEDNLASFGGIIEKALLPFVNMLTSISTAFSTLSPSIKEGIVGILAFVAAFAPILTGLGFFITTIVPAMTAGWGLITAAVAGFNAVLVTTIEVILPWIAGIAAAVAIGQVLYDNWNSIKNEGAAIWAGIKGYVLDAVAGILGAMEKIPGMGNMFTSTIQSMRAEANTDLGLMQTDMANSMNTTVSFGQSFNNLKNEAVTGINGVKSAFSGMVAPVTASIVAVGKANKNGAEAITPPWITALGQMKSLGQTMFEAIGTAATSMADNLTTALTTGGMDWNQELGKALQAMLSSIVDWAVKSLMATDAVAKAIAATFANPLIAIALIAGLLVAISSMHMAPPAMAMGGIVTSPTTALIGEAGPEAVLPVVRLSNGQMGVQTNNGGGGAGSSSAAENGGNVSASSGGSGQMFQVQVYLDSKPILNAVSKASRTGKLVIHPNAVRVQAVNVG